MARSLHSMVSSTSRAHFEPIGRLTMGCWVNPMSLLLIEFGVLLVLILINGFLAMSEMAMVSAKRTRLMDLASKGSSGAKLSLELQDRSSELLASIQVGITLVGVLAGTFSGATISETISGYLDTEYPALAAYSEAIGVAVVVIVVTYLSLILGELVPKRVALNSPESTASRVAQVINLVSRVTRPLVWFLAISTESVLKILRIKQTAEPVVTEEEVKIMIEQGTQAGVFEKNEESMLKKVMMFTDLKAQDVMTPRTSVVAIDSSLPKEKIFEVIKGARHSYYPVFQSHMDNMIGLLSGKLMLEQCLGSNVDAIDINRCIIKDPLFIPTLLPADDILEKFKSTKKHVAIVVDEFGGFAGFVSIIDILESIVGNIPDSSRRRIEPAVRRDDGSWLLDGLLPIHEIIELTDIDLFTEKKVGDVFTLAGFLMQELGKIPREGESVRVGRYRLEVMDMDGNKVDKVLLQEISSTTDS